MRVEMTSLLPTWLDLHREGETPSEPRLRVDASPGSRLSRSFALPRRSPPPEVFALTRRYAITRSARDFTRTANRAGSKGRRNFSS